MAAGYEDHLAKGGNSPASGLARRAAAVNAPDHANPAAEHILPGLQPEESLPWLHSAEDDPDQPGLDPARVWAFVLTGFALLAMSVGGVWWTTHRRDGGAQLADGSLITAPPGPIKVAPQDPGGKTFDGTGDSSFAVSQGHVPGATLAAGSDGADDEAAIEAAQSSDTDGADTTVANSPGGIGVQVGAFTTQASAEAAWARLAKTYDALSGAAHRIVEGKADIGTVYRLQAVAGSAAAANALCDRLKTAGLNCEVKE
jgi:hypothetical protein